VHRWVDRTLNEVLTALEQWFEDTTVTSPWYGQRVFPVRLLAAATGRRDQNRYRDAAHGAEPAITLAALEGSAPPVALVPVLCARVRADGQLTDERAALLRVLLRRHRLSPPEVMMPELNPEATSPAYLCGRLLAVADALQRSAIPDLNTSVADKVLGRCSMAPGSILPRVLTDAQAHLKKLRTSGRGAAAKAITDRLDTIAADLHAIPTTLTLPEQGEFLLGFLHQRHADTTARRTHSADADQKEMTDV
jgi:CRISPR-associated protein Csd1